MYSRILDLPVLAGVGLVGHGCGGGVGQPNHPVVVVCPVLDAVTNHLPLLGLSVCTKRLQRQPTLCNVNKTFIIQDLDTDCCS